MSNRIIRESLRRSERFLKLPTNLARMSFVFVLLDADDLGNFEAQPADLARLWREISEATATNGDPVMTVDVAEEILETLCRVDLVRLYVASNGKRYGHVPRFKQRVRFVKNGCPRPPENISSNENNILLPEKTVYSPTTVSLFPPVDNSETEKRAHTNQIDRDRNKINDVVPEKTVYSPTVVSRSEVKRSEELQNREVPRAHARPDAINPAPAIPITSAIGKTVESLTPHKRKAASWVRTKRDVAATAKTCGIQRREGESDIDFRDRVFEAARGRKGRNHA